MSEKINNVQDTSIHQENNIIENQNNENIDRENQNEDQDKNKLNNSKNGIDNDTINNAKKKKLKKRRISETIQEQVEEFVKKKSKQDVEFIKESVSKKKSKDIAIEKLDEIKKNKNILLVESSINQCDNIIEKTIFNWKGVILDIVKNKGEISLKKLQKKVISQYMNSCSNIISYEKACNKFNKKLKKISEIIISDEKVTLI